MKFHFTIPLILLLHSPTTLSTPAPDHTSRCQIHPTWELHGITYGDSTVYSTPSHMATAIGTIEFSITNTAVSYISRCSGLADAILYPDLFYGTNIYPCTAPTNAGPGVSTNFTYSRPEGKFVVNLLGALVKGLRSES
jgi:hypothetical protein